MGFTVHRMLVQTECALVLNAIIQGKMIIQGLDICPAK